MTEILQIFSGNPLATFIGKRIEAATRPELESDEWSLNLEICDMVNENDDDAKDAVRAIKKRLQQIEQDRNFTVTNRTLTVLETCVSNCSRRFHVLIMSKDFIQDLVKLIGPKNNPPIELQERVLRMIERWADAFRNQPDLSGVVSVYNDLKAKGVTFPPKDPSSNVPILTPQRSVPPLAPAAGQMREQQPVAAPASAGRTNQQQPPGPVVLEGEGYNKISQDLSVVQTSVEMFQDLLKILESSEANESDWKLAADLSTTTRQMKERIVDLIERVANEDLTIELLRLNDDLNNIFIKYDRLVKNKGKQTEPSSQQTTKLSASQSVAPSSGPGNELSLIDFNIDEPAAGVDKKLANNIIAADKQQQAGHSGDTLSNADKLTMQSDSLVNDLSKMGLDHKNDAKKSKLPEEISSVREQDFAEIENWLSTDSGRNLQSVGADTASIEPISIPNSEFDNFIASRALAGSTTSKTTSQQTTPKAEPSV